MKYEYFQAYDDGNILIRRNAEGSLEKFDNVSKGWINDDEIYRMYFGDMPVKSIKEDAAIKYIGRQA